MQKRPNTFKSALKAGRQQLGIWSMTRDTQITEMLGYCGFDWVLIDCEHTPTDEAGVLSMLQALSACPASPVVRPSCLNVAEIKRLLDVGAQNLIVPYVQTVEEAQLAAAAVAYPPHGIRGVSGGSRAALFGNVPDYIKTARDDIALIVQIETQTALDNLEAIAAVPGIDGLFIGPADLATSLGQAGNYMHPDVVAAIIDAMHRIRAAGKPAGFLAANMELLEKVVTAGCCFTALHTDMGLFQEAARARVAACAHWRES